jgi:response regulator RpfG family c-di-GMP phosphodiesterase
MDIHMPVMGGNQATQIIKTDKDLQTIPVIALTAYAMKEQIDRYQDIYDGYLSKPISKKDLIATLAKFLFSPAVPEQREQETVIPPLRYTPLDNKQGEIQVSEINSCGILEELKDYIAQTEPFPQPFVDKLRFELLSKYTEVSELMSIDDIMAFSKAVIVVGDAFTVSPLKHYGEELLGYLKVFNIVKVRRLLAQFPDIVKIIADR